MKIKNILFISILILLMSFSVVFAASEKAEVPKLSEKEQAVLKEYLYNKNPLINALEGYNTYPRLVDYLLVTQPGLVNKQDKNNALPLFKILFIESIAPSEKVKLFNKILSKTSKDLVDPSMFNLVLLRVAKEGITELLPELVRLGADINGPSVLSRAVAGDHLDTVKWIIDNDEHDKEVYVDALDVVKSPEVFKLLLDAAKITTEELDKPNRLFLEKTLLDYQIDLLKNNPNRVSPLLVEMVLQKLKKANTLTSISKEEGGQTLLCRVLKIMADSEQLETKEKARQIAHVLINNGAVCEDQKMQKVIKEIESEGIHFTLQGTDQGIEPGSNLMHLINEYLTGVPVTQNLKKESEKKVVAQEQVQKQSTASTSAVVEVSPLSSLNEKVVAPQLTKEEQALFDSRWASDTFANVAIRNYKEHPNLLNYVLITKPGINNDEYSNEWEKALNSFFILMPPGLTAQDKIEILRKIPLKFLKRSIDNGNTDAIKKIKKYAESQKLDDILKQLADVGY